MNLREIDRLVAEKVMGWEPVYDDGDLVSFVTEFGTLFFSDDDECEWSPTIDIADAWKVVEKLRESKKFTLHDVLDKNDNKVYYAQFHWIEMRYVEYVGAHANTAPLAICLAALKAVGFEVGHVEDIEGEGA
ncbi:hypothetical protein P9850_01810 [Anoxybacillus rupiensis]|uniref:Phage ABA sandwich domain-containing protein n=1 Tax=Anoxybacteroides rupiense TaxID=311460 RepID=A0ABD5IS44_9BACL|nr:hypothetical protein [Anoxybacillus rupiensis]